MIEEGFTPAVDRRTVLKTGALAGAFAALSGITLAQDAAAQDSDRADISIVVVSHGQASDPFWSVVQNGVAQAGEDMGVNVQYQAPGTFDMVAMSQLIDAAVATSPNGLIVSIPDADALSASISAAVEAGIPVISMNSGSDVAAELGILTHVGQTEYEAGFGGGQRMAEAGVTNAICVNQEVGNAALDLRCQGFTDALAEAGGTVETVAVDLADPTGAQQRISAALTSDETIDGILTLGPTGAAPALAALTDSGQLGEMNLATFDLSPEVLDAIEAGEMLFAIDQQQYLQGYLPVVLLTLYNTNLNTIANPVLMTGPGFVTQDTAARIKELSAAGTR
ncbi:MAG: sugar ABC transporter substrate-binding protein [Thermomicrobiales bacterium]|nr:sugar ABC transporter substrate-binding protein [Thermomicrobiales bacterium]MCO5221135.1 sugar ABC transporter substrate-binding protein [Thermomicrobiales bacterium]